jgi:hypothetical protein
MQRLGEGSASAHAFRESEKIIVLRECRLKEGFRLTTDVASLNTQVGADSLVAVCADSAQKRRFAIGLARRTGNRMRF